jgi:hypothetical protein
VPLEPLESFRRFVVRMGPGEHRANATAVMSLALQSDDNEFRVIMLRVAREWLDLAQQAEKAAAAKKNGKEKFPRRYYGLRKRRAPLID